MKYLKRKEIIIGLIGLILIILSSSLAMYFYFDKNECICNDIDIEKKTEESNVTTIKLEVKGEVKNPGVYELNENSIIKDVINLAGGFTNNANTSNINLSMKVKNEMVIYIYKKSEYKKENKIDSGCKSTSYDISNCTKNKESIIITDESNALPETSSATNTSLVNINTASIKELMSLSGIGETKAKAIISYREKNGLFKSIEEIKKVNGIGNSTYDKFKESITI